MYGHVKMCNAPTQADTHFTSFRYTVHTSGFSYNRLNLNSNK